MSLRGGLLRLMMTGIFIQIVGTDVPFVIQFIVAEVFAYISVNLYGGILMCIKTFGEIKSLISRQVELITQFLVCHLSYRYNLLMS